MGSKPFLSRIEKELSKSRNPPSKIDVRNRNSRLLKLEGWYNCDFVPYEVRELYNEYITSGSKLKFTRWLSRTKGFSNNYISEIGKFIKKESFKLSCRHKDILRISESNHFHSCFNSWRGIQKLRYLADPDIAVLYIPDKSGKFIWRALVRLIFNPLEKGYALFLYKWYGNTDIHSVIYTLSDVYPVFIGYNAAIVDKIKKDAFLIYSKLENRGLNPMTVTSPTVHNNPIIGRIVWSDHGSYLDKSNRIRIKCVNFCVHKRNVLSLGGN